jgi:hypothetical protein
LIPIRGRLTLATAVLSALSLFTMSVLPLPKGVLAKMDRPRRALVWKAAAACSGGDCQVAWDFVCRLREEGGLGVVDFSLENTCLLLKVLHGLLSGRDTPWTRWVKRSYLCSHPAPSTSSWRHFSSLIPLYRSITRVVPGDGASTSFWFDSWSPLGPLASALPAAFSHCLFPDATLAEAIGEGARAAVIPVRHRLTAQAEAELAFVSAQLRAIHLTPSADRRLVSFEASEEFRTADVYRALCSSGCIVPHQGLN